MTPKEKAIELFEKMYFQTTTKYDAKQCALIAVDELIQNTDVYSYWDEVKSEIEKL